MKLGIYPVILPSGRKVKLAELAPHQLLLVYREAGNESGDIARGLAVSVTGLRHSLREVDGTAVVYSDLMGKGLEARFKSREVLQLGQVWGQIHQPGEAALAAVRSGMSVEVDSGGDRHTVTLADGTVVVFAELGIGEIQAATRVGGKETARAAADLRIGMEGLRRSLVSIGGRVVDAQALAEPSGWAGVLRTTDVVLLAALWSEIHLGEAGEVATLGEAS